MGHRSKQYWVAGHPDGNLNSKTGDNWDLTEDQVKARAQKLSEVSATNVTAAELDKAADASVIAPAQYTATAAVASTVRRIELAHNSTPILITGPSGVALAGQIMCIVNTSASGTAAHLVTLSAGTFDGTNNRATLNAPGEALVVFFDSAGAGMVVLNTGSVGLSSV
tara:strand:- start:158 stop:658 length:501 start_codon:yes stop_codon:yes gene_type:complete